MNKTTQNISLKPIFKRKEKFTNVTLFDRREKAILETLSKPIRKKNRSSLYLPKAIINKNTNHGIYLTETDYDKLSTDTNTTSFYRGRPIIQTESNLYGGVILKQFLRNDSTRISQCKSQIDFKTNALNRNKENVKDYIDKTREMLLMQYTSTVKKERAIRLKETYDNEIESLNDTIKSLNLAKELFNDNFFVKFGEYVKHLSNQREIEKVKSATLLEEIIQHRNEISQIQSKIRKIEADKSNVIRWLYFQIQMKEKLITLPSHYKKIIDDTEYSHKHISEASDLSNITGSSSDRGNKRRNTRKTTTAKPSIPPDEEERIRNYKLNVIYPTANIFLSQLKKFEDDNILLIERYNELTNELRILHKEKNELLLEIQKDENTQQTELEEKIKELEKLKSKNKYLSKIINQDDNKFPLYANILKRNKINENLLFKHALNKSKLYGKVFCLYKMMLEISCTKMEMQMMMKKIKTNSGDSILFMLKQIEISVDGLIGMFKYYNKNKHLYYDVLRKIKSKIEKKHKMENALRQKEGEMLKLKTLKEQIEERNNKVYYKHYRKVDNYYEYLMKKEKKIIDNDDCLDPLFSDFMFDVLEDKK